MILEIERIQEIFSIKNFNTSKHNNLLFIIFQVEVKGTGWISLALTFRGNLMGSDIIIGWVASDQSATIIVCKMRNLNFQVTYTKFLIFALSCDFYIIFSIVGCPRQSVWTSNKGSLSGLQNNFRISVST
mgnify:CR=1 FL=1